MTDKKIQNPPGAMKPTQLSEIERKRLEKLLRGK